VLRAMNPWVAGLALVGVFALILYLFSRRQDQSTVTTRPTDGP